MTGKHYWIRASLLVLLLIGGALGAPLIGPLRERVQELLGVSRGQLGAGVLGMGIAAGVFSLWATVRFRGVVPRTTFVRLAAVAMLGGLLLFTLTPLRAGWPLWGIAAGWFFVSLAGIGRAIAGPIFMDLWKDSPHTGVILLHGVNAVGKVLAPLVVLAVGDELRVSAGIYTAAVALLLVDMCLWPKRSIAQLHAAEREQLGVEEPSGRSWRGVLFWICAVQFALIAGSEAGVTSILGSFVSHLRPSPVESLSPGRWAAMVLVVNQLGIVAGRFAFVSLSSRLRERTIIVLCLLCGLFAVPGALIGAPVVYVPSLFLLGVTFSATWPAFFTLSARSFVADRTAYSTAAGLATQIGISVCIWMASAIGNREVLLPTAVIVSTGVMGVFGAFLFLTTTGRALSDAAEGRLP